MTRFRPLVSIPLVLLLAAALHLDWHLARPQDSRLSLDWSYHWLAGVFTLAAAAWFVARKWPADSWAASALNLTLAVTAAQLLEPLGQAILYGLPLSRVLSGARWTAFAEFMAAGLMSYLVVMAMLLTRRVRDRAVIGRDTSEEKP